MHLPHDGKSWFEDFVLAVKNNILYYKGLFQLHKYNKTINLCYSDLCWLEPVGLTKKMYALFKLKKNKQIYVRQQFLGIMDTGYWSRIFFWGGRASFDAFV